MNKEKIAKFILECRKEKELTQQNLADMLYVSANAVSKWERGICLPDVTTFDKIAEVLGVSVAELVMGEKIPKKDPKIYDDILINNMKDNKRKIKKKNIIIISLVSFIIISILSILIIFFYNNYNNITVYSFRGSSNNFEFSSGTIVFSRDKGNMVEISNFKLSSDSELNINDIDDISISIYFNDKLWASDKYNSEEDLELAFFSERTSYECLAGAENCSSGIFDRVKKSEFPNNLKIKINYCVDSECEQEEFEIVAIQIAENKLIN